MTTVFSGLDTREVVVEMQEMRAGQMRCSIRKLARADVGQVVSAVDDDELRIGKMPGEFVRGDQRCITRQG